MFLRSFSLRSSLVLWDYLVFRGEIIFFQLLLAVFDLLRKQEDKIQKDKIFESIKMIILENEAQILTSIEKITFQNFEITSILHKYDINI